MMNTFDMYIYGKVYAGRFVFLTIEESVKQLNMNNTKMYREKNSRVVSVVNYH